MTAEEIEKAAWNGTDISRQTPEFIDDVYWLGMTYICGMYHNGLITKDRAAREKKALRNAYERFDIHRKIYRQHQAIERAFDGYRKELETCGCDHCAKMLRLIDGREVPDEIDNGG